MDKHRETQLQLQRKLQEKKLLEEQKRKMNSVREENEQQLKTGRKTPLTPRVPSRTSATLEHKAQKIPSTPSPLPLQSPRKFKSGRSPIQAEGHVQPLALSQSKTGIHEKSGSECLNVEQNVDKHNTERKSIEENSKSTEDDILMHSSEHPKILDENVFTFPKSVNEITDDSKTPEYIEMEVEDTPSHVRRIDFGKIKTIHEHTEVLTEVSSETNSVSKILSKTEQKIQKDGSGIEIDVERTVKEEKTARVKELGCLSQSAGQVSLKMLLERKDLNENSLNKSLGFVSSVTNNLFSSQSNSLSRSAFVPFSHSRKEISQQCSNISSDASSSLVSCKQTSQESMPKSATITITPVISLNQGATNIIDNVNRPPDNIIHIQPGITYQESELSLKDEAMVVEKKNANKLSVSVSAPIGTKASSEEIATTTSKGASATTAQDSKSLSYHVSPGANKQIKTPRFTPIKPKSSPQKSSTYVKTGAEIPAYDKRPVSAILKEKREREKAEALAKIQASIKLPTIHSIPGLQFQQVTPALTLNSGQIRNIAPLSGDVIKLPASGGVPSKDVLIFVNNNSGAAAVPTLIAPSSSQCFQKQLLHSSEMKTIPLTKELMAQFNDDDKNKSFELRQDEKISDSAYDGDCTPNIEEIILSPEESDTNLKEKSESDNHAERVHESMEIEKFDEQKSLESDNCQEDVSEDRLDSMESQTPVKIAKLNVNSPFRPESACSLGRETPIKIMKTGDLSLSRPESACSLGRDTPSGGRKRKSSGNTQQRNFKRLNSTGEVEDNDNITNYDLGSNILPSQKHEIRIYNQRRTHSCTLELDKERKNGSVHHHKSFTLDSGSVSLQSPDITSLEREALIDAFPHTVCSIPPSKAQNMQKSSVGVSSESFRNALKLKKQQEYLNERVNSFLMKENTMKETETISELSSNSEKVNIVMEETRSCSVAKDFNTSVVVSEDDGIADKGTDLGIESDIPSDVADFINETIEKRQSENTSALSEPNMVIDSNDHIPNKHVETINKVEEKQLVTDKVKFLGVNVVNLDKEKFNQGNQINQMHYSDQNKDEDHFTVPKVPPFSFKFRDGNMRFPNPDVFYGQQRCSSLPSFTSPVRSPVSPHGRQGIFQRSSSISPSVGQSPDREISNISQGALRRVEVRENHPISISVHPNLNTTDDGTFVRPNSLPVRITHHDEKVSQIAPYLASIQHNLQKPRETPVDPRQVKQKDSPMEKPVYSSSPVSRNQLSRESSAERTSFTPFSDRGYHSIGSSPILNSTPVSLSEVDASANMRQSPRQTSGGADLGQVVQVTHASLSPKVNMGQLMASAGSSVVSINQLNTSTTSAFIPIQGSSNEFRYVTPIRPMATVASEKVDGMVLNPGIQEIKTKLLSASNRVQDPPPYEYAVRQLRESGSNSDIKDTIEVTDKFDTVPMHSITDYADPDPNLSSSERIPLLANMGQELDQSCMRQMGPCASRLAQLSRQSKQSSNMKPSKSHPSIISALNEPAKDTGQLFTEQKKICNKRVDKDLHAQDVNERNSSFIPSNYFNSDLIDVSEQNFSVSEMSVETTRQTDINVSNSKPLYGQSKIGDSFSHIHSSDLGQQLGDDDVSVQKKIFNPSFNVISSDNVLPSTSNLRLMPPAPRKVLSDVHNHSNFSSDLCNLSQNIQSDDTYQEITRHEYSQSDMDPLGNTLEDLKAILSDKSVVGENGFYSETDISAGEEGLGELLF